MRKNKTKCYVLLKKNKKIIIILINVTKALGTSIFFLVGEKFDCLDVNKRSCELREAPTITSALGFVSSRSKAEIRASRLRVFAQTRPDNLVVGTEK